MRTLLRLILISALTVGAVSAQTPQKPTPTPAPSPSPASSLIGKWTMTLETEQFTATPGLEFAQKNDALVGTYVSTRYGSVEFKPVIKNRAISFSFQMTAEGTDVQMSFTGEIAADFKSMKGTAEIAGMGSANWSAVRAK